MNQRKADGARVAAILGAMYARFFGLNQEAFSIAPDPRYLYMSDRHSEALALLRYGLDAGGGFVLLTGEIGAGKTTLCRSFLEHLPENCDVAYLFNPRLSALELVQSICGEFGVALEPAASGAPMSLRGTIDALNQDLLEAHAAGRDSMLVIDEAQNLSIDVLEQLRLLTNLETSEKKLLQIVLIGQPELRAVLARPELEQLAQRVVGRFHLDALSRDETARYIAHRMHVAGLTGPLPFDAAALRRIHQLSGGVPRRVNLLAGRALLGAYATGVKRVDQRIVAQAAREIAGLPVRAKRGWRTRQPLHPAPRSSPLAAVVIGAAVVLLVLASLAMWPTVSRFTLPDGLQRNATRSSLRGGSGNAIRQASAAPCLADGVRRQIA